MDFIQSPPHPEQSWGACLVPANKAAVLSPALDCDMKDANICAGPDGWYYLTGTMIEHRQQTLSTEIEVRKSRNLKDWVCIGTVWSIEVNGTWQKQNNQSEITQKLALLSPKLQYFKDTFWITYGLSNGGTGLLKSITGIVEGPYLDMGKMTDDGTDATIFIDDEKAYWVYADGKIALLKVDFSGLQEEPRLIEAFHPVFPDSSKIPRKDKAKITGDKRIGTFGASMRKIDGLYFLFCSDLFERMGSKNIDTFAAVSSSVYGPYSRRYLVIPNGSQPSFFEYEDELYAAFSGCGKYSPVENKPTFVKMEQIETGYIRPAADVILEKGYVGSLKPVGDFPIRDTQITYAPDGNYYMTGTSNAPRNTFWGRNDGVHVWRSTDLIAWEHLGLVWNMEREGSWHYEVKPQSAENRAMWAPEIHFIKGTFYITYSLNCGFTGLLKSSTGDAKGPYIDIGKMTTDIDASLFWDDDGTVYYVWQGGMLARMKDNMEEFDEEPVQLLTVTGEKVGYEGAFIIKKNGKYILGCAEWNGDERIDGTYDLMYGVADNIYGPYSQRRVAAPHAGHGTMFINKEGKLMTSMFGNDRTAPFRCRPGIIPLSMNNSNEIVEIFPEGDS